LENRKMESKRLNLIPTGPMRKERGQVEYDLASLRKWNRRQ
jgi:hypothetical protein